MTIEPRFIETLKELAGFTVQEWHDDVAQVKVETDAQQAAQALAILEQYKNDTATLKTELQKLHDAIPEGHMSKTSIFNILGCL
jgi:hypothetical protein